MSDHFHYWEDGGSTYHNRYNSWEFSRGQEGDTWKGLVDDPLIPEGAIEKTGAFWRQDWVNRMYMREEKQQPQAKTFTRGLDFIRENYQSDQWFLQIETFDPHEPFFTLEEYKQLYPHEYSGPHFDWPNYGRVGETDEQVQHIRYEYAALLSMCDKYLGQVLDNLDELDLWSDTMLIVNTDHGYSLGDRGWWGKSVQPFYNEISHIPLFIWDPRSKRRGNRINSFVQTIDLAPTLLDFFGVEIPPSMQGVPIKGELGTRKHGLFGIHGGHVNYTDGRYVYMRAARHLDNRPLFEYTLFPTHMKAPFDISELQEMELVPPFAFTKGCSVLKITSTRARVPIEFETLMFDLEKDPLQENPIQDEKLEDILIKGLVSLMVENDAPQEQYERLGLTDYV